MAAKKRPAKKGTELKKKNFTIWLSEPDGERVKRAVQSFGQRAGVPVAVSHWLHRVVMMAVEEEEKRK